MSKLVWDQTEERLFETGVEKGVLFPIISGKYTTGVAWNGLIGINESSSGAESTALYADNYKYLNLVSAEEFGFSIEAYTYPDEFMQCIGENSGSLAYIFGQQKRKHFGLAYRTIIGNDVEGTDFGYKLHIVFDCLAGPTEKGYNTINDSPEAISFSWEVNANPVAFDGYKPSASIVFNSVELKAAGLSNILTYVEDILYGSDSADSTFLTVSDILEAITSQMYLLDSSGDFILDSNGDYIRSMVY